MKRRFAAVIAMAVLCVVLFCGAAEPEEIYIGPYNSGRVSYIDTSGSIIYAAVGNNLWSFDEKGGNICVATCSAGVRSCLVSGSSVYFITDKGSSFGFEEHSVYGGLVRSCSNIIDPSLYGYVTAMTADGNGNAWVVVRDKELWLCNTSTGEFSLACMFKKAVSSLHWVDSRLYAVCGSRVYFCEGQETVDASSYADLASKPVKFYGDTLYVDNSGNFCTGSSVLFGAQTPDAGGISHYTDGYRAWYLVGERSAVMTDLYGNILREYKTEGLICAVCDKGLLTVQSGELRFAPYDSAPQQTPTPEPTKEPDPGNDTDDDVLPELPDSGDYMIVEPGSTVTDITNKMNCEIWKDDRKVTSGLIRTGMTARSGSRRLLIVVTGDANGSGTVNSADFRAIQEHLLEIEKLTGAYYIAADVSGNGTVGTEDLVLILKNF